MSRTTISKPHRKFCVGDMRDRVRVQGRSIEEPDFGSPDYDENFTPSEERWAGIKTSSGKTIFDGVSNVDVNVTHEVHLRYDAAVTSETWLLLDDGCRLDILSVEDLEERHEFLKLLCTDRGKRTIEASKA